MGKNPSFIVRAASQEIESLEQGNTTLLKSGDILHVLVDLYPYRIQITSKAQVSSTFFDPRSWLTFVQGSNNNKNGAATSSSIPSSQIDKKRKYDEIEERSEEEEVLLPPVKKQKLDPPKQQQTQKSNLNSDDRSNDDDMESSPKSQTKETKPKGKTDQDLWCTI